MSHARRRVSGPIARVGFALLLGLAAVAAGAELGLTTTTAGAAVSGATPGGSVACLLAGREDDTGTRVLWAPVDELTDDDGDGKVVWALGRGLPVETVVVAVDMASGALASLATNEELPLRQELPAGAVQRDAGGGLDEVRGGRHFAELLVVRPGVGAWHLLGVDGDAVDEDGARDGGVELVLAGMEPLGASPAPPAELAAGDVVVVIDPESLAVSASTLTAETLSKVAP